MLHIRSNSVHTAELNEATTHITKANKSKLSDRNENIFFSLLERETQRELLLLQLFVAIFFISLDVAHCERVERMTKSVPFRRALHIHWDCS